MKSRRILSTHAKRKAALATLSCVLAAALWPASGADAATDTYTPAAGVTFNNPYGSTGSQYAIENKVVNSIHSAPSGSDVTIVTYNFTYPRAADALIAADARGVHVRVLVATVTWWDPQTTRLRSALGTDKTDQSFITHCRRSCMSDRTGSSMHAKFFLFSKTGRASHVAMFGSSNLSINSAILAWNNQYTTVGQPRVYAMLYQYFLDMTKDRTNERYYRVRDFGNVKLYLYPKNYNNPTILDVLNGTTCKAARGYGSGHGRTLIRLDMFQWTAGRIDIAKKLRKLWLNGCSVRIIYNKWRVNESVREILMAHDRRRGDIPIWNATRPRTGAELLYAQQNLEHQRWLVWRYEHEGRLWRLRELRCVGNDRKQRVAVPNREQPRLRPVWSGLREGPKSQQTSELSQRLQKIGESIDVTGSRTFPQFLVPPSYGSAPLP
ncbi:phospholipase D-like domain-containing protein [Microlunatus sp. Gsoil 973]|uniref:phospholipase D-like domain-containing protein n=1 Tax=Microlunatus sp. Gsoil 973 TaxID=2672569 RepID=UPI0012B44A8B|nr:phospholipase D-like domain-containing protein [Microlunatus sp. Gsoil 973]QGN34013.1 hypothetical protein GJV80_15665 [Microlunatus sp. Gsoil 973]